MRYVLPRWARRQRFEHKYPPARRCDYTDSYFETSVVDPYRWLETPDSAETQSWIDAQTAVTAAAFSKMPTQWRDAISNRLNELSVSSREAVYARGARTFFEEGESLYVQDAPDEPARLLLPRHPLPKDKTLSVCNSQLSPNGDLVAYELSQSGSDWHEIRVRDVATGKDLDDHLRWIKFCTISWSTDSKGFHYSTFDKPADLTAVNHYHKLFHHRLGTSQSEDLLVFESKQNREWLFHSFETADGQYLLINIAGESDSDRVYFKEFATGKLVKLIDNDDAKWDFVGNDGSRFWFHTDLNAPRGRLVTIDINKSSEAHLDLHDVIPEPTEPNSILDSVQLIGDRFFAHYSVNGYTAIQEIDLDGSFIRDTELPDIGFAKFVGDGSDSQAYFSLTSYISPHTLYSYDFASGKSTVFSRSTPSLDQSKYTTRLAFATSKDGTQVPMFISYRQGLRLNGRAPTILYGYGGFEHSLKPSFSASRIIWLDMGGIYVDTILRGDGDFGKQWHHSGTKLRKQNSFDDFIACAEWLIDERYTSTPHLAIKGESNGGLLVGASMTQRPDLFGACLPGVGVLDMLRYDQFTAGTRWRSNYGSAEASKEEFEALLSYSPYHNIEPGISYPPTLIRTADHDDRVVPAHSLKFAAALQAAQSGSAPILLNIQKDAGHGAGLSWNAYAQQVADEYCFLIKALKIPRRKVKRMKC